MEKEMYFDGVFFVIPNLLYQGAWSREWRQAAQAYQINIFIDAAGVIPEPLPRRYTLFASWPIKDNNTLPDIMLARSCASLGASLIAANQKVIVCCLGGINRSAFVCGLILHQLGLGNGREIVLQLRDANPDCLDNSTFRNYLEQLSKKEAIFT